MARLLRRAIFYDTNPIPMKYMMKRLGILERNEHRLLMVPAPPELVRRLDEELVRTGLVG
jgi:4-hydroxy-tetrahydrodipicolinate synthase